MKKIDGFYNESALFFIRNLAQSVVQNLTSLTYGATLGELTSLEELVSLLLVFEEYIVKLTDRQNDR